MNYRQTKILATLGPASNTQDQIRALLDAGANAFRLNFSHGSHDDVEQLIKNIRAAEKDHGEPVAIVGDLQGPKIRIGTFKDGAIRFEPGHILILDQNEDPGDESRVYLPHPEIFAALDAGDLIFFDDGKVRASVLEKESGKLKVEIQTGTKLSNKKGVNVPGKVLDIPALTEKDKKDLAFALKSGVDWVAQSFVQRPEDVAEARKMMKDGRGEKQIGLMIKIEKPSALQCFDQLLDLADGVMIARGDLGIEIPPENVPSAQKTLIQKTRARGKPVVVATQMLESMIENARPTRAEASDVATAVYDGADTVMLSAETAAGAYPVEAVTMMNRIARRTEEDETYKNAMDARQEDAEEDASDSITTAAYHVARKINAKAIVCYTSSGSTALRAARQRPYRPIICLTPHENVARRLAISYGVRSIYAPETMEDFSGPARYAGQLLKDRDYAASGDKFVMTAGVPFGTPGSTNILRIAWVD